MGRWPEVKTVTDDIYVHGLMDVPDTLVVNQQNKSVEILGSRAYGSRKMRDKMHRKIVKATYNNDHKITY